MKKRSAFASDTPVRVPIALVGIGCRFPGHISNPATFWQFLTEGRDGIIDVPDDRWNASRFHDPVGNRAGSIKTRKGGFVDHFDQFDADFFGVFPAMAHRMDPQQRFLLETTFEALEDAGVARESLSGTETAVYMGVFMADYWDTQAATNQREQITPHTAMGAARTSAANRISYLYNLKGPSVTLDTACSSSLVGVHLACQSIWSGESTMALAGGVNIMSRPETSMMLSQGNFLSPDGYCKTYDSRANGYVRSEGCGVVLLKPLPQAEADGDSIYGVIRGSAVNQDGYTEKGFTVPSVSAQVAMLRKAYAMAGVDPKNVSYVEAHGTGTPVGDPIETNAFGDVIGQGRSAEDKCWVGSVKSNFGHTEAAAGVAGLIKLALVLKNRKIPQNLHFENPNPAIPFEEYRLRVPTQLTELTTNDPLAAPIGGVNSFGAGGTNAHVVMQAYQPAISEQHSPSEENPNLVDDLSLFTCSAQSEDSLKMMVQQYQELLQTTPASLASLCFAAARQRSHLNYRLTVTARTKGELQDNLAAYLRSETRPGMHVQKIKKGHTPKVGFIFSGQGPQWYAMGQQLLKTSLVFRDVVERIDQLFSKIADWSLLEEMNKDEASSRVSETRIAQPAIMAVQIGLTELWKSWGVQPEGCVGHSIGEVAAAYTVGALTLEQAVEVIYHRSRGQNQATDKGKMLAVALTPDQARLVIADVADVVSIAAVNGPAMLTLSGDAEPLERISQQLEQKDIFNRFLRVNVPFHSHHMEPLKEDLISSLTHLVPSEANVPLYSTVTGQQEDGRHLTSDYWYQNVREPVYFTDALRQMVRAGFDTFIEVAPHPVLTIGASNLLKEAGLKNALIVPSLRRKEDEAVTMLGALGQLHTQGYRVNWEQLMGNNYPSVKLPAYVWQHQRYWFEAEACRKDRLAAPVHPLLATHRTSALQPDYHAWSVPLTQAAFPFTQDHQVSGTTVFPGTGHLEIALSALRASFPDTQGVQLRDIHFTKALYLNDELGSESPASIRLEIKDNQFALASHTEQGWTKHSYGNFTTEPVASRPPAIAIKPLLEKLTEKVSMPDFYLQLKEAGLNYGETFRRVQKIWKGGDELLAAIHSSQQLQPTLADYHIHPALLDACLHTIFAARAHSDHKPRGVYLPVSIKQYTFYQQPGERVWTYVKISEASDELLVGDYQILSETGELVATIEGLMCQYIPGSRGEQTYQLNEGLYDYRWEKIEHPAQEVVHGTTVFFSVGDQSTISALIREKSFGNGLFVQHVPETDGYYGERTTPLNLQKAADIDAFFKQLKNRGTSIRKVVFCGAGITELADVDFAAIDYHQTLLADCLLNVLRTVEQQPDAPSVVVLTGGAESIVTAGQPPETVDYTQAPLLGISRVFINEYPYVPLQLLDVPAKPSADELALLTSIIYGQRTHTELGIRDGHCWARQLVRTPEVTKKRLQLSSEATYLITGGASGFGLEIARWFVERGAKHLVLLSRSGCKTDEDRAIVDAMWQQGVSAYPMNLDITDTQALEKVVNYIHTSLPPLRGIVHSAAVIDDQPIPEMTAEVFSKAYRAKALGAWNLHQVTQHQELDFFLMLSSISAVFGFPGQANYSSANTFLDKLALHRQSLGLKGSAINLGVLDDYAGMSQDDGKLIQALIHQGWKLLSLREVTAMLEQVLVNQPPTCMTAFLDWRRFGNFYYNLRQDSRFVSLMESVHEEAGDQLKSLPARWKNLPVAEQPAFITGELTQSLVHILGVTAESIDTDVSITAIGLDSLMLNQLRNWIQQAVELNYPLMRLAKGPSLQELAQQLQAMLQEAPNASSDESNSENDLTNDSLLTTGKAPEDSSGISQASDLEVYRDWIVR